VFAYASDHEFFRYLPVPYVETLADEERFIAAQLLLDPESNPSWAITIGDVPIGGTDLRVEREKGRAEIGYGVGRTHWGKGYTTEAAGAVIDWAFASLPIERLAATADVRNIGSWRVMEKLGMQREAILRSHEVVRGERRDTVVYSILRPEWEARRA
jgi:RimJ/RimL family protein N-acetyltransferase